MARIIGLLLQVGVGLSAAIVLAGGVIFLVRHGHDPINYGSFRGAVSSLRSLGGILHEIRAGSGRGLIQLGLVVLIATPIARVAFALAGFAVEKDRTYVGVTALVLALLLFSLLGGGLR